MRLKKIPKGTKIIIFTNPWDIPARVFYKKQLKYLIDGLSFCVARADNFSGSGVVYPELQLYSNLKIKVEYE